MKASATVAVALLAAATAAAPLPGPALGASESESAADPDSLLHVPAVDYRLRWTLLGSFSVRADDPADGAKELHVAYAAPETVEAHRATGRFPDGAVLVKDVYATETEPLTTGVASYADSLAGRFVMVKDAKDRYADAFPPWGDGWGRAFYEGAETMKTVTTDYAQDCLGCHEPVRGQHLVYVQGYPILKR